jgi:hypothetical protein
MTRMLPLSVLKSHFARACIRVGLFKQLLSKSEKSISKPTYPYNTIITFLINYTHYNTIITLL